MEGALILDGRSGMSSLRKGLLSWDLKDKKLANKKLRLQLSRQREQNVQEAEGGKKVWLARGTERRHVWLLDSE